jgi:hypothetical protein
MDNVPLLLQSSITCYFLHISIKNGEGGQINSMPTECLFELALVDEGATYS